MQQVLNISESKRKTQIHRYDQTDNCYKILEVSEVAARKDHPNLSRRTTHLKLVYSDSTFSVGIAL
jgi:hypothetical protein